MWTHDRARDLIAAYLEITSDGVAAIQDDLTLDRPYGWVFFYQARRYLQTKDPTEALVGNAPIIFDRFRGEYRITGTAKPIEEYLREYEAGLPREALEAKPQLRARPNLRQTPVHGVVSYVVDSDAGNDLVMDDVVQDVDGTWKTVRHFTRTRLPDDTSGPFSTLAGENLLIRLAALQK